MMDDKLETTLRAAWEARILLTAVELGIPDRLEAGARTAAELAAALGADARALELFLNALAALGVVEATGGRFSNSAWARDRLVTGAPAACTGWLRHHAHLWRSWSTLTDVVRTGRPSRREPERPIGEYHDFVRAMHDIGWERAQALAGALDLAGVRRMLDLGGGPASYAIAFCARNPGMQAVVFDRPPALDVAREIVAQHGAAGQVALQAGDFLTDDLGSGYDLVLVSQIVHSFDEATNRRLLAKAAAALVPGGRLVLQDFLLEESRCAPAHAAVFAINMLVNTEGGRTYTWGDVEGWLDGLGFADRSRPAAPGPAGVIVARKALPDGGRRHV